MSQAISPQHPAVVLRSHYSTVLPRPAESSPRRWCRGWRSRALTPGARAAPGGRKPRYWQGLFHGAELPRAARLAPTRLEV